MSITLTSSETATIRAFGDARRAAKALPDFPGIIPDDSARAYAMQDAAIDAWDDGLTGWKVALVRADLRAAFGSERLAGPVFKRGTWQAQTGQGNDLPVIPGGFAAVEAEFVIVMGADAPAFGRLPSLEEAASLVGSLHIGIELAGSPLKTLNDLGAFAIAPDFGNNTGVIIGSAIADWQTYDAASLTARMEVDGVEVGKGSGANLPNGPLGALAYLIHHLEGRSRPLKKGQVISTGATTGVHVIAPGQSFSADFGAFGTLSGRITTAKPLSGG
jgi:2-keto-4-pentenoate hydratase